MITVEVRCWACGHLAYVKGYHLDGILALAEYYAEGHDLGGQHFLYWHIKDTPKVA